MKQFAATIFRSAILLLTGVMIGMLITGNGIIGYHLNMATSNDNNKLSRVIQLVYDNYVDHVDQDSIETLAINHVLQNLDPHSLYLPARQAENINQRLEGGFEGLGIEYQILRDTLYITQVYPNGPAEKAGISNGDRVVTINNNPFAGTHLTVEKVHNAFSGEKDSKLELGVLNFNSNIVRNYNVKRGHVELSSLDAAYLTAPATGYIKISRFASTTDSDFKAALTKLKDQGMKRLVLDLRGNGGGYLNTATALADEFLPKGKLIVYTQGYHEPRTDYFSTDSGLFQQGKLAILIDEHSASASEILSGALQDLDRATIVGRRSFGKGLVQQQFPFGDGSAVNLTVARYYTPSGRCIQKSYKNGIDSYHNELAVRMQKGELYSAQNNLDDSSFKASAVYHTSTGKKVYSGGGIMPDVFVAEDTASQTQLITELGNYQLFMAYVIDKMQPTLNKYTDEDHFIKDYQPTDNEVQDFVIYSSKTIREMDSREIAASKKYIKLFLKATAARFKWGNTAFNKALGQDDEALKKAMQIVS